MVALKSLRFPGAKYMGRNPNSKGSFAAKRPVGILLHYTAGGAAAERLAGKGGSNVSAHFTVDRDGSPYQCGDLDQRLWHAGPSHWKDMVGLNEYYIGIEQANLGYWRVGEGCPPLETAKAKWLKATHRNESSARYWEPYAEKLLTTTEEICRWLIENIPTIKYINGHDEVAPRRKADPGPVFPMQRFKDLLRPGLDESAPPKYKVASPDGELNVRGPAPTRDKLPWGPLKNGDVVEYLREEVDWIYVRKGKDEGWCNSMYLKPV